MVQEADDASDWFLGAFEISKKHYDDQVLEMQLKKWAQEVVKNLHRLVLDLQVQNCPYRQYC